MGDSSGRMPEVVIVVFDNVYQIELRTNKMVVSGMTVTIGVRGACIGHAFCSFLASVYGSCDVVWELLTSTAVENEVETSLGHWYRLPNFSDFWVCLGSAQIRQE